jgi:hypothetical protein
MTTKGKGGVYHTTDLIRQTPGGEREEEEEEEEDPDARHSSLLLGIHMAVGFNGARAQASLVSARRRARHIFGPGSRACNRT